MLNAYKYQVMRFMFDTTQKKLDISNDWVIRSWFLSQIIFVDSTALMKVLAELLLFSLGQFCRVCKWRILKLLRKYQISRSAEGRPSDPKRRGKVKWYLGQRELFQASKLLFKWGKEFIISNVEPLIC